MENDLIIWAKSDGVTHINYHYTQFGEVINYLNRVLRQKNNIIGIDQDIDNTDIIQFIKDNNIKKVAIMTNYENANNAFELSNLIKNECNIPIMAYGPLTIMHKDLFKNSSFSAIHSNGDYERSIYSFLSSFEGINDIEKLQGLNLISNDKFIETKKGEYIDNKQWGISSIAEVPIDRYDNVKGKNRYVLNLSRGCPFGCTHCLIQLTEGNRERRRDIENTKLAIDIIKQKYNHIKIWAANFTLNKKYVNDFCDMMIANHKNITWECATRIDLVKDTEMLKRMYEAGCRQISLGIESLNNAELIDTKDFSKTEVEKSIDNIQNSQIKVKGCVMLGMPNQTIDSVVNTLKFLKEKNVIIRPTIYTPYHLIDSNCELSHLSQYNRKTYKNENIPGITQDQLLNLVSNPYDYENILGLRKKEEIR